MSAPPAPGAPPPAPPAARDVRVQPISRRTVATLGLVGAVLILAPVVALLLIVAEFAGGFDHTDALERDPCPFAVPERSFDSVAGIAGIEVFAATEPWTASAVHGADRRVLQDGVDCWFAPPSDIAGPVGRIASLARADARPRFADEVRRARSARIGGVDARPRAAEPANALGGAGYYRNAVDAFDEAFCTTVTAVPMSGVLVRRGDRLVYVTVLTPLTPAEQASITSEPTLAAIETRNCDLALRVAGVLLAG